jgi:lysophospholipase L1-like esterase
MTFSRFFAFIVLFSVTVFVMLGAIELALRLKNLDMRNYDIEMWRYSKELKKISENPVLGHEHLPTSSAELQSVNIRINSRGLRGKEIGEIKPKQRVILFLGSSITLGWGVKEEDTLTSRLQSNFDRDGKDTKVLNAGIGNYNAVRYVERYLTKLSDIPVTDIVVQYFVNDSEVLSANDNLLLRHSELAVTLWRRINQFTSGPSTLENLVQHYRNAYSHDYRGYIEMKNALEKLAAFAEKKHIRFYLAMTPDIHNMADYPFTFIHEEMKKISSELGYRYIDLYGAFAGSSPEQTWSMPGDPHPNGLGHKWMADAIYPILAKE